MAARYKLKHIAGPVDCGNYEITKGPIVIGRKKGDIIVDDEEISGAHCELVSTKNEFYIKDLNTTNGTYVNDEKIIKVKLSSGDLIRIGRTKLVFEEIDNKKSDEKSNTTNSELLDHSGLYDQETEFIAEEEKLTSSLPVPSLFTGNKVPDAGPKAGGGAPGIGPIPGTEGLKEAKVKSDAAPEPPPKATPEPPPKATPEPPPKATPEPPPKATPEPPPKATPEPPPEAAPEAPPEAEAMPGFEEEIVPSPPIEQIEHLNKKKAEEAEKASEEGEDEKTKETGGISLVIKKPTDKDSDIDSFHKQQERELKKSSEERELRSDAEEEDFKQKELEIAEKILVDVPEDDPLTKSLLPRKKSKLNTDMPLFMDSEDNALEELVEIAPMDFTNQETGSPPSEELPPLNLEPRELSGVPGLKAPRGDEKKSEKSEITEVKAPGEAESEKNKAVSHAPPLGFWGQYDPALLAPQSKPDSNRKKLMDSAAVFINDLPGKGSDEPPQDHTQFTPIRTTVTVIEGPDAGKDWIFCRRNIAIGLIAREVPLGDRSLAFTHAEIVASPRTPVIKNTSEGEMKANGKLIAKEEIYKLKGKNIIHLGETTLHIKFSELSFPPELNLPTIYRKSASEDKSHDQDNVSNESENKNTNENTNTNQNKNKTDNNKNATGQHEVKDGEKSEIEINVDLGEDIDPDAITKSLEIQREPENK